MSATPKSTYGVTPTQVMASMSGLDFVRGIFAGTLPAPPIMETVEPFDLTAETGHVVFHSVPGFRPYSPIGSVHGGCAAILLDSAMGLAVTPRCRGAPAAPRWNSRSLFIERHDRGYRPVRTEARCSAPAAAPPPPKRASPTPRAGCSRTPPRRAWCSRLPKGT